MSDIMQVTALIEYMAREEDVLAVYLFGSQATGKARAGSDVDVAVLLSQKDAGARFQRRLQLMGELGEVCGSEADVIVLNDAPPVLQHQVLKAGELLYERDLQARVDFEVRAGKIYADLRPQREFFRRALFQEVKEAGLGGR